MQCSHQEAPKTLATEKPTQTRREKIGQLFFPWLKERTATGNVKCGEGDMHNLYQRSDGTFVIRLSIDRGPKLVAKRKKVMTNTKDPEEAKRLRDHTIKAYKVLGLKIRGHNGRTL